jgi:hypothetical protein
MANQSGFQSNTTIHAAFWWFKPDPAIIPPGKEIIQEINTLQRVEATADQKKVWLYYAANNVTTSQEPYTLEGDAALAFMSDMEGLFA